MNERPFGASSCSKECGGCVTPGTFPYDDVWAGTGVAVGEEATVRVWLAEPPRLAGDASTSTPVYRGAMPDTSVTIGIYQRVDPTTYPLPPRPEKLARLQQPHGFGGGKVLDKVGARTAAGGPNTPVTLVRTLPAQELSYQFGFVAPGQVLVSVDGITIGRYESWGCDPSGAAAALSEDELTAAGVNVRLGEKVTITLTPSRFTYPGWELYLLAGGGPGAP